MAVVRRGRGWHGAGGAATSAGQRSYRAGSVACRQVAGNGCAV